MHRIEPHALWTGHAGDGRNFRAIVDLGIEAVVQLALEEPPLAPPRELIYVRFPLVDGAGNRAPALELAISTVSSLLKYEIPTLLCCGAGMSRSVVIAAAALMKLGIGGLQTAVGGRSADVSPALWADVERLCRTN